MSEDSKANEKVEPKEKRICKECHKSKSIKSFGVIEGNRRKSVCNPCLHQRRKLKKLGLNEEEYDRCLNGPCQFCGEYPATFLMPKGENDVALRVCGFHKMMFRYYDYVEGFAMMKLIIKQYPFWSDFLKKNNLSLFAVGAEGYQE